MRKKIRFYHQHSMETCGASCALMLLDLYRKVEYPTPQQEQRLYGRFRSRAFRGMTGAAVAECLAGYGLRVRLLHSSAEYMDNRDGYFTPELFAALLAEYRAGIDDCGDRVEVRTGVDVSCARLREELDAGRQLIVECIIPGDADGIHDEVLHWIVVYGYEGEDFLACDPLSSKLRLTEAELARYMDTPIGQICISVGADA